MPCKALLRALSFEILRSVGVAKQLDIIDRAEASIDLRADSWTPDDAVTVVILNKKSFERREFDTVNFL